MNIKMNSTENIPPTWDFEVDDTGCAVFIDGDEELLQNAQIASYLSKGSTSQLSADIYSPWLEWMTGNVSFGDLDIGIRESIELSGSVGYYPDYSLLNNKLQTTIKKE